jgi:eukaryotic-like serine/threonine-protein kinase
MNATRQIEDALFFAAASIADGEQRLRFLDQACIGNAALRRAVDALLAAQSDAEPFFAKGREALMLSCDASAPPAPKADFTDATSAADAHCSTRVGPYKLLQRIGEGGCGVVYMAEQEEPLRRRVALKIIKLGMDTKAVIARFEAERQALAMMDHPNIARVLDAGATETGRPFFVMELVRGFKITDYCDQNHLNTQQRLELFIPVCNAIQHAHQKGIIHRDIKPSNILVTMHDGKPVPKVIDFGIAKAIQGKLTDKTLFTAYEQLIGTPAYMSPEQAEMSGLDVDTRSDIYCLGVLLYELLTSKTPFNQEELLQSGLNEMRRKLREDEPQRPSAMLTTLQDPELRATAECRHIEAPRLISLLKGDLDWIVLKSLEKDRTRRYATANDLASDVERYLNNDIVTACPPSRRYRLQKLMRRNRALVLSSGAIALALTVGLGMATWMAFREHDARRQQVRLLIQAEQSEKREAELRQQAEAREQIIQAAIYVSQDKFEEANEILRRFKTLPNKPSYDAVLAYRRVGERLALQQRWPEAADRYFALMEIDKLEAWDVVTLDYQACGVLLAETGERERYDHFCYAAIDRFKSSTNGDEAGRVLKTCLLFPPAAAMQKALAPIARVANQGYRPVPRNWPTIYLALWDFRQGDFSAVDRWCRPVFERSGESEGLTSTLRIIQAMADQKRGYAAQAAQDLAPARRAIESYFEHDPLVDYQQGYWYDWLFARILLREALPLVEGRAESGPGSTTRN